MSDQFSHDADIVVKAVAETVAMIFNTTPLPFRPLALAALRSSTEASVATMPEEFQSLYHMALDNMVTTAVKH